MKKLAQRVIEEDLAEDEVRDINIKARNLKEQVRLLEGEAIELS